VIEPWRHQAACNNRPTDYWFPEQSRTTTTITPANQLAITICHTCPVQQQCLTWALTKPETHGIWGGLTAEQRRQLHLKTPVNIQHGTKTGYETHLRHGQPACRDCKRANADYRAAQRRINQRAQTRHQIDDGDTA
jgi:WhiB family redox-sensing transcriptional regulator